MRYTVLLLISVLIMSLPIIIISDIDTCIGHYVEYDIYGYYIADLGGGNITTYHAEAYVKYFFKEIVDDRIVVEYTLISTNDTHGLISPGSNYQGKAYTFNMSVDSEFNSSIITIYVSPSNLPANGYIRYVNISTGDEFSRKTVINAYFDPETGILINNTVEVEVNNTVEEKSILYHIQYRLASTDIRVLNKYIETSPGTIITNSTTTTEKKETPLTTSRASETSTRIYPVLVIPLFIALITILFLYNHFKNRR